MAQRGTLSLVLALSTVMAYGQTAKSTLSGVIRDESQAAVSQAKILVTGKATGLAREAASDASGRYTIANLDPGIYEVRAEAEGFRAVLLDNVVMTVGGTTVSDITLKASRTAQAAAVMVTYQAPLVDITSADLNRVVRDREIAGLPNRGRNFVDFVKLSSGVAPGRENVSGGPFKEPDTGVGASAAPRLSFGGQSELSTKIAVDGADNVQTFTGLPRATPSQEAAAEFRILNSTYLAEYGGALGGFVNIVTKSGSNALHGSTYYFGNNGGLNAAPVLNPDGFVLRQNQYGATLGGALVKDKSFFFLNYEGQRRTQSNTVSQVIQSNLPLLNRVRTAYGLTPEVEDQTRTSDYDLGMFKLDQHIGQRHFATVRYNYQNSDALRFPGVFRGSAASSASRNTDSQDQSLVAGVTSILSGTTVNDARLQWAKREFNYKPVVFEPAVEISNLISMGKTTSDPDYYAENRTQFSDNVQLIRGAHQFKTGIDFNRIGDATVFPLFFPARIIFPNLTAFSTMSPVVFWYPTLKSATSMPAIDTHWGSEVPAAWRQSINWDMPYNTYGLFWQDEWKVSRRVNLTYGLRYDVETFPAPYITQTDWKNLQPRVGFAWAAGTNTAVRLGWGIFSDRLAGSVGQLFPIADWSSRGSLPDATALFPTVAQLPGRFWQNTIAGPGAAAAAVNFLQTGQYPAPTNTGFADNMDARMRTPYAHHASVDIEHNFGRGTAISASYLFVSGEDLLGHSPNLNAVQTGTLASGKALLAGRRFATLGDFAMIANYKQSNYNGATLQFRKENSRGFGVHASYTFSKTMSNGDSITNMGDVPEQNTALEYARSRQDVAHRLTLGLLAAAPHRLPLIHDFRLSSLIAAESGRPFTIFTGSDANGDGNPNSDRPGILGRNTLEGPGYLGVDLRIARDWAFNDRMRVTFALDGFNALNRVNVKDLNTVWGGADLSAAPNPLLGFGTPRDVFNAREIQYSIKLTF